MSESVALFSAGSLRLQQLSCLVRKPTFPPFCRPRPRRSICCLSLSLCLADSGEIDSFLGELNFCLGPADSVLSGPSLLKDLNTATNKIVKNLLILNSPGWQTPLVVDRWMLCAFTLFDYSCRVGSVGAETSACSPTLLISVYLGPIRER